MSRSESGSGNALSDVPGSFMHRTKAFVTRQNLVFSFFAYWHSQVDKETSLHFVFRATRLLQDTGNHKAVCWLWPCLPQFWWFCHQLVHTTDRISMTEGPPGPFPSAGSGIPKEVPKPYTVPEGYVAPKMSELWLYVSSSQPLSLPCRNQGRTRCTKVHPYTVCS